MARTASAPAASHRRLEPTAPGFVHFDLKHQPRLRGTPAYVLIATERSTRLAHVEV